VSPRRPCAARVVHGHWARLAKAAVLPKAAVLLVAALLAASACRKSSPSVQGPTPSSGEQQAGLPPLELTPATPGLLLTWADDQGDFHVVETIDAVPEDRREKVRVVLRDRVEGTGDLVYVADLRAKQGDHYAVNVVARSEWEEIGAAKRKSRMEAFAPGAKRPGPEGSAQPEPEATPAAPMGKVTAIVYGASWCKPCHDAERYLKGLGVQVTKKDIEESPAAQAEMQTKLARTHKSGASIPVIDVMGQLFVGYNPGALKRAVDAARQRTL
jgi:glutaredoxin